MPRARSVVTIAVTFVTVVTQQLGFAQTVNITIFSGDGQTVAPDTRLHVAGNASWPASSIDSVEVLVRHKDSLQVTDSMSVMVTKDPAPAKKGT
ncbi:hypothetical protein [Tautonia rosea]|uniref:hypothetical protein n=1 Tax=Tautonia rosea TaxID=2728037 RepID=UPI00147522D2|nr:hypothetical protein [Tautonia rosea]